jgi:serine/threonine protein phosphatase PrpC
MNIEHAALTLVGRRQNNEDSLCADPELGLFAVADGMGGYEGGEVASRLTVDALAAFFRRNFADADCTWPFGIDRQRSLEENRLLQAVRMAHSDVAARRSGRLERMGSTVAALAIAGDRAVVGHVGDSRVYRLRAGTLAQLTRDHSVYNDLVERGMALPPKAESGYGNMITKAIGIDGGDAPDLRTVEVEPGDVFLVCSDGLNECLDDPQIAERLALAPADACGALVADAYAGGARDNITAVVVRVSR